MEGICGRMCDACTWKEQLDCPGCQDGPGAGFRRLSHCGLLPGEGHTACVTCTFSTGCALRRRDMPQNRLWAVEAERAPGAAGPNALCCASGCGCCSGW
ncbi:MAG: hypothetical protein ACLTYN_10415 [Dysosmobacter welbionis]